MHFDVFVLFLCKLSLSVDVEVKRSEVYRPAPGSSAETKTKLVQLEVLLLPLVSHQALLPPADTRTDALGPRSPAASLTIHAFIRSIWI